MQPKLLRVLEARAIRRVGETEYRPVDVRVIAASLKDLREMVNRRAFREDLYFRLAVIPVRMPALREHLEDLPLYIDHFLEGKPEVPQPTGFVLSKLLQLPWLGNVRDVRGVVARAAMFGWDRAIDGDDESTAAPQPPTAPAAPNVEESLPSGGELPSLKGSFYESRRRHIDWFEREYVKRSAAKYPNDIYEAATVAGVDHTYMRKLRKKWGV